MTRQAFWTVTFLLTFFHTEYSSAQAKSKDVKSAEKVTKLFRSEAILSVKMTYSNKKVKKETNDTTYLETFLAYATENGSWDSLNVRFMARGNYRRTNCYFAPLKFRIKKKTSKGTLFTKNKELKLVLPCLLQKDGNDNIIKEYMAYKIYETLSPYHFKTRLLDIELSEKTRRKIRKRQLKAFFIEDIKRVAARAGGNVLKRNVHPLGQDDYHSLYQALFQFMIGNTDFSTGFMHNSKLLFNDIGTIPVPYDFDMSGLVNTSYSTVSEIQGEALPIKETTERIYRGFKRDEKLLYKVRNEFLQKKSLVLTEVKKLEPLFEHKRNFEEAIHYIEGFYGILASEASFKYRIVNRSRKK